MVRDGMLFWSLSAYYVVDSVTGTEGAIEQEGPGVFSGENYCSEGCLWGCVLWRPFQYQILGLASQEGDFCCGLRDLDSGSNPGVGETLCVQR